MEEKLNQLKEILAEVDDLKHAKDLLEWDQQTYMPSGGAEDRGHLLGTLSKLAHQRMTSPELGRLLDDLRPQVDHLDPDSDSARLVKVAAREFEKLVRVPAGLVAELAEETALAYAAWQEARSKSDFPMFRPHLEKIIDLRRRYAQLFAPFDHIYDPLLDDFEPGMKTAEVQAIFNVLCPRQVKLIQAITNHPQIDDSPLHQHFNEQKQWDFGVEVISKFGYDWNHGRLDTTVHPFTISFGMGDVRITTRVIPDYVGSALFSTMHECGHALYDLGYDPALGRTLLADGASYAIHESQSRLWENLVGRSYPFWEHFYPHLQAIFPQQLGNISLESFYKGINKVEPSLIRVEADEATYNLHIMLRLEVEIALVEGALDVKDLPEAWNTRMQEYLGLVPPDDAQGVLQDVHWSAGYVGYFPTYALGNLVSAQLWEVINRDIPDLTEQIRRGEFAALLDWLRQKVHRHGKKFEPQELVQRVTGSKIDPAPYLRYLERKYAEIYNF